MRITSDRSYPFPIAPSELWVRIQAVDEFPRWWPWLHRFDGQDMAPGAVWQCTVRPPLPYALSFAITIDEVVEHERVTASITGEIVGRAALHLAATAGGCTARLCSQLAPASRILQAVALVARPVAAKGHDWVLDTGARQFHDQLAPP